MKRNHRNIIALLALSLAACSLSGCSTWDKLDRTERGAVIGTGGGAAVGAAVGAAQAPTTRANSKTIVVRNRLRFMTAILLA